MTHAHTNRLAKETSPYLLQHAHNPVDWYAWGDEAFEAARAQNKPIFLSVGYSTCYWCHVMERQCFENPDIAQEMNQRFINIKVDREERPDVDQLYMTAVQLLTRQGGWPMSVFLLPDLRPFYGGTYFPPTDTHGRPGFVTVLKAIEDGYKNRRDQVEQTATQLTNILQQIAKPSYPETDMTIDQQMIDRLVNRSAEDFDAQFGGFGGAPKFPRETLLEMLLTHLRFNSSARLSQMLIKTLDAMANGGIRDQLGGAFHRYSTDAQWLVPHFEIMLYDNAMLAWIYAEAFAQTKKHKYAEVARGICDFILREMTSPEGAFYTAFDAEVDAKEGGSYLWTADQIREILGDEDAKIFNEIYGVDRGPNFADPHQGSGQPDANVLYLAKEIDDGLKSRVEQMREKLYTARRQRKQPLLDTKIITSWNALMIRGMSHCGKILEESRYTKAAERAARFLVDHHLESNGTLYRTSRDGAKKFAGFLDDYASFAQALLDLGWRDQAQNIADQMQQRFSDPDGGFFFNDANATDMIVRQKSAADSPLPSGNAVAAMVMLALDQPDVTRRSIEVFAQQLEANAEGLSALLEAAEMYVQRHGPIEIAGRVSAKNDRPLTPEEIAAGVVSVEAELTDGRDLRLHLKILPGFHINSHSPAKGMIGTVVAPQGVEVDRIEYPPGELRRFAFAGDEIRVYENRATVLVKLRKPPGGPFTVRLSYQTCDENACFPAVTKNLQIGVG